MGEFSSDDEEYLEKTTAWHRQQSVIIGIDCTPSMFEKDKSTAQIPFQSALNAIYKLLDNIIFQSSLKYKISIQFLHSDPTKSDFMDFDSSFTESFLKLQDLIENKDSHSEWICKNASFKDFILTCKKIFRKDKTKDSHKTLFFITNNADPSGNDEKVKFHVMQEFEEFEAQRITFELLPMIEDFDYNPFYKELYQVLDSVVPKYYYDQEFLSIKLDNTVKHVTVHRNLNIYLGPNISKEVSISCRIKKYSRDAKLIKINVTRDGNHEVVKQKMVSTAEKYNQLILKQLSFKLTNEEKAKFQSNPNVDIGITIIHASKTRYSTIGENLKTPQVVSAKDSTDKNFIALWEACNMEGLHLLCYLKFTDAGHVYYAELIPKMLNQDRQFLVLIMPEAHNISKEWSDEIHQSTPNDNLKAAIDGLVDAATIESYDITTMKPYKYQKQIEYLKQEILGSKAIINKTDLVNDVLYTGEVDSLVEELKGLCPSTSQAAKRKGAAASKTAKKKKN